MTTHYEEDYEEEPTLPVGMSPPIMLSFARLPTLGRSPAKSAATHIRHTLLRDALRDAGRSASASASVLTPPSFSRYTHGASASLEADPELDSLMRRVSLLPRDPYHTLNSTTTPAPITPPPPSSATTPDENNDESFSSSSSYGEEDSMHNTAHPSAAFLLASRQRGRNDDHDNDDEEDDSLDADPDAATASFEPVHPFARAVAAGAEDDSFDSLDGDAPEEETVFGARHVKRGAAPLGT
jgi:DASH complex subunit ASK1